MSKLKKIFQIFILICILFGILCVFIGQKYTVPILMYHSVNPGPDFVAARMITVSPETFERQMRFLKTHGYNVIPLDQIVRLLSAKEGVPAKTVSITFDDGNKDNFVYAFPILRKYNLPATEFLIVDEVGRASGDRLSWEDIKTMQDSGLIVFGSHTLGPQPLINIKSEVELRRQIFDSKRALEEKLGRPVIAFSYPEGMFNAHIRQLVVDAGYHLAVATNPGKFSSKEDIFALKRLRISENARNPFVFWFETSGIYTFFKERRH